MASLCTQITHNDDGCTLTIITKRNGENIKIQRTTQSIVMMEKFKRIHERKIPKFGDHKNFSLKESDNIVVKLSLDSKVIEKAQDEQFDQDLKKVGSIKCRYCGGEHLSMRCPNKDLQKSVQPEAFQSSATTSSAAPSKYIPPSRRGAGGSTEVSMMPVSYSVRVSNLFPECTEEDLRDIMSRVGRITRMYLPILDGRAKGYAYVNYATMDEVERAVKEVDGRKFGNVILGVEVSQAKKP